MKNGSLSLVSHTISCKEFWLTYKGAAFLLQILNLGYLVKGNENKLGRGNYAYPASIIQMGQHS